VTHFSAGNPKPTEITTKKKSIRKALPGRHQTFFCRANYREKEGAERNPPLIDLRAGKT
jgi:hypothetical protein